MFLLARAVQMAAAAAEAAAAEASTETQSERAARRPIVSRSVKGKWTESHETMEEEEGREGDRNLHGGSLLSE